MSRVGHSFSSQPSAKPFSTPPNRPTIPLHPFKAHIAEEKIDELKQRLHDLPDINTTYENSFAEEKAGEKYGVTKEWIEQAVRYWRDEYDWRKTEEEINAFPNFTTHLSTRDHNVTVHFMALFSEKKDAVPVVITHGWPGSILEFIPLFKHLTTTYTPATLPVHLIAPSLIGFGFSSPPPRHDTFTNADVADLWDSLMKGVGFEGYVAQGGDIGSFVSSLLVERYDACKAVHFNMWRFTKPPENFDISTLDEWDQAGYKRMQDWANFGTAYKQEHATRTATIGIVIESSPLAMLAWIGEKFLEWSDEDPSLDAILGDISLYWLTKTFSTSLYHYRNEGGQHATPHTHATGDFKGKPIGYSAFPKELRPIPTVWVKDKVTWLKRHDKGGHFAALEQPVVFWEDLNEFIEVSWKK